jgi:hypothetical protein
MPTASSKWDFPRARRRIFLTVPYFVIPSLHLKNFFDCPLFRHSVPPFEKVSGPFALVGAPFTFKCAPFESVSGSFAFAGTPFAFKCAPFESVTGPFEIVGGPFAFVSTPFEVVGVLFETERALFACARGSLA